MERRLHPRVELPIEVEFSHPSVGTIRTTASDISEGGVFVEIESPTVTLGAKVKITVLGLPLVASTPTPTLGMEVVRVAEDGVGLAFDGVIAKHLWSSIERFREVATVGQDLFQVYQGALVVNDAMKILVVQQNGKWLYPGDFLIVGQDWRPALAESLAGELGLDDVRFEVTVSIDSLVATRPESAIVAVFHRYSTGTDAVEIAESSRFNQFRWVSSERELRELSFSDEKLRELAIVAINQAKAVSE